MPTRRTLLQLVSSLLILTILFSGFSLPSVSAQGNAGLTRRVKAQTGTVNFILPESRHAFSASNLITGNVAPLAGATWYVATTGSDTNSCSTPASPCLTINGAIGKAASGDTIKVAEGIYTGTGSDVVDITNTTLILSGGWKAGFATQTGYSTIDGEKIRAGVGIGLQANVTIDRFIIQNGASSDWFHGGGITNNGVLTLNNSMVMNNTTAGYGGGIDGGRITINNSAIFNNRSAYQGGGIRSEYSLNINNSTISNNWSGENGGGLYAVGSGTINNSTITGNYGLYGGGVVGFDENTTITNSIISDNTSGDNSLNCSHYGSGSLVSGGNNIIGDISGCLISPAAGDQFNVDPQLLPFISSRGYQPLKPTSPAINAGNSLTCLPADQRGIPRTSTCDIGAYEYMAPIPPAASLGVANGDGQSTGPNSVFSIHLQVVSLDIQGSPIGGLALKLTAPLSGASGSFDNGSTEISLLTDGNGFAKANFKANGQSGKYVVTGSANGLQPINFHLENAALYVSPNGSDLNDCKTPTTPCATINGVVGKAQAGGTIDAAAGIYKGSGDVVVTVNKNINLSGGWNNSFTVQNGYSTINGEDNRSGILVNQGITATFEKFIVEHGHGYNIQRGGIANDGSLTFNDCEIRYNDSRPSGGGGIKNRGQLTLNNCRVVHNSGVDGGGIYNEGSLHITSGVIAHNSAGEGAGIYNFDGYGGGFVTIDHTLIENNQAGGDGGGISNRGIRNQGTINIKNTGIHNNSAWIGGGGISNRGIMTTSNVSVVGNQATSGGGIYNAGSMDLKSSTISANTSMFGGGVFVDQYSGNVNLKNTLIASNIASSSGADCSGKLFSAGNNLISSAASCVVTPSNGDLFNVDPHLGIFLSSEGYGPLLLTSPAIDAGDDASCPATDQRGLARPYGIHCDIGAYEAEYILIRGNAGAAGVTLSYEVDGTRTTIKSDSDGNYLIRVPISWSGIVTPFRKGYAFTPANRTYSTLQSFQTGQNYTAQYVGGADTTGVFRPSNGALYLKNKNETGFADIQINYGVGGDYPVVGDWDGDGDATIGIYRNGSFYLRNENTIGFADMTFPFGKPGDQPVAGDWDGDGVDTIGVYRNGTFFLRNSNDAGPVQMTFSLGIAGDVGIAGDWNGDGVDTTGVFRPSNGALYLKNTNVTGFADIQINYGLPGDKPVTGDWNNDGIDTIGVYRNGQFMLRNSNTIGFADIVFALGIPGDMPIAGNWDGLP